MLSPLLVIALLLATFEGYAYYTRHQPTKYSRGGAFGSGGTADAGKSSAIGRGSAKSTHSGSQPKQRITKGGPHTASLHHGSGSSQQHQGSTTSQSTTSSSTGGGGGHKPSSPSTGSSAPPASSQPRTALVTPQAGTYTLAVRGHEQAKFGPFSPCNNNLPARSSLVVHHAAGESKRSFDFDWRLYPNSANKHDERHIYTYSKHAVVLTFEQETVTCAGIKQSSAVDYKPNQIRVRLPLTVGATWHNHGGGSARTEAGSSEVAKQTSLTVAGQKYAVYEIVTKLALSGNETGERDQTWWYSPELGMPLKFSETLQGKRSGASYSESYTATVVGMP
ncbi:MAG: hypothetical protein JO246_09225 [Frankiaceae bacterium]|nr:hypothetical protein [Frankiaceae bacterium]